MIRILYFARFREQLGTAGEEVVPDAGLARVTDLVSLLCRRGGAWSDVFGGSATVLIAVNQEMAGPDTPIVDGDEVAFLPPVTGG